MIETRCNVQIVWNGCLFGILSFFCVLPVPAVTILPEGYNPAARVAVVETVTEEVTFSPPPEEPPATALRVVLRLREPDSTLSGRVMLPDVCDIETEETDLAAELAAIDLGQAPEPGQTTYVFPRRIAASLRKMGLQGEEYEIHGAERLAIESNAQALPLELIEEAVRAAFAARAQTGGGAVEAKLLRKPTEIPLPPGSLEIEVADLDKPGSGIRNVVLNYWVDGVWVDTQTVSVRVSEQSRALVAARGLEAGSVVRAEDLVEGLVQTKNGAASMVAADPASLVGKRLKRPVAAGLPIGEVDVEWTPLKTRGGVVQLIKQTGGVSLSLSGELLEDVLYLGQQVRVRSKKTRKEIVGKAVAPSVIQIP